MSYSLYIDDEREPKTARSWIIARTYDDAISIIGELGVPSYLSFDHDLGTGLSGYDIAKWIVEQDLDGTLSIPTDFQFNVHSANPVGRRNIECLLDSYLSFRNQN